MLKLGFFTPESTCFKHDFAVALEKIKQCRHREGIEDLIKLCMKFPEQTEIRSELGLAQYRYFQDNGKYVYLPS